MKRRMLFASLAALLSVLLALPVLAHPGRTDSKGGHFDHSSGTYHYHHGYPAHQHRDLDGDGKPDCPYDFKDTGLPTWRIVLLSACAVVAAGAIGYGIYKHKSRKGGAANG